MENYITVENQFITGSGDSSKVNYSFNLEKPFCAEEVILFFRRFFYDIFNDEFIEEINDKWHLEDEELEIGLEDYYADLQARIIENPEEYGLSQEDVEEMFGDVSEVLKEQEELAKEVPLNNLKNFKEQLNKNPDFLENVFRSYLRDTLEEE